MIDKRCDKAAALRVEQMQEGLCECGHPKEAHGPQEWPPRQGQCRATIYVNVENGMNAWPCRCGGFKEMK